MTKCKYCGRRHEDQIKCKKKAEDPDCGMPDPDCDHENKESVGSHEGRDSLGQPVSVLEYRCKDCGGAFAE